MALVVSIQNDPFFEIYSAVDERSAAYMACGLSSQCGEPVVLTCTGATASRNYMPGLTEAYYRKLPILAITSTPIVSKIGHHVPQVIDRSTIPNDVAKLSVTLPVVSSNDDIWDCEIKVNNAILELSRHGGGPAHINLQTTADHDFSVTPLSTYRKIERITAQTGFPKLPSGRIAVFIGSHSAWSESATRALELFCESNNAIVISDHTSGYKGKYNINYTLVGCQALFDDKISRPDLLIHIGEISGDYYGVKIGGKDVWRVSPDGEIRDFFKKMTHVFEMEEASFFEYYISDNNNPDNQYFEFCQNQVEQIRKHIPELPLSNIWIASKMANKIPENSTIHFGILNSLRAWNFFDIQSTVVASSNVGGFGIDGALSTTLGASLVNKERLFYCVLGDLAFFYDMNALGNRHVGENLRILVINNGKGTEFRQYGRVSAEIGDDLDKFVAASGHFGGQSRNLVKHYAQDLGFEYITASNKKEFSSQSPSFLNPQIGEKSIVFEVFTKSADETLALTTIMNIHRDFSASSVKVAKGLAVGIFGEKSLKALKKIAGR